MLLVVLPVAAWFIVKPVRVLAPSLVDVACPMPMVCVDDPARLAEAAALYDEAQAFVSSHVAPVTPPPKVVFCSTAACAASFGLGARAAVTLGTWGTVIAPRGWQPYLVRHEMIHVVQARRLNVFRLLFVPKWFVEGMAYTLSEDPRPALAEPWESYRREFREWYAKVGKERLWEEARKL
jgi:hypothetical protein